MSSISAFFKKNGLIFSLLFVVISFIPAINFQISRNPIFSLVVSLVCWLVLSTIALITKFPVKLLDKLDKPKLLLALLFALVSTVFYMLVNNSESSIGVLLSQLLVFLLSIWFYYSACPEITKNFKKRFVFSILIMASLVFLFVIYLPFDSFVSNINDFEFDCTNFTMLLVEVFGVSTIGLAMLLNTLKPKFFWNVYKGLIALNIAVFIQYMFLNSHLSLLGVANDNSSSTLITIVNLVIWIVIFAVCYLVPIFLKNNWINIYRILSVIILGYHIAALVVLLVLAPSQVFKIEKEYYFDASDQFTLSSNKNVIVFVFDAYDNSLLKETVEKNPSYLDGLEDFTVYTNTSCVFDSTVTSMNQMFGGCGFDNTLTTTEWLDKGWNSETTNMFYDGLHNEGYICNGYNFELPFKEYAMNKLDNVKKYDNPESIKPSYFDLFKFYNDFELLACYRIAPYFIKNFISFDTDAFKYYSIYPMSDVSSYSNSQYLENMNYKYVDSNIFTVNHLHGIHSPCIVEDEVENCAKIMNSLIDQLKASGVYDNSTIIFMSDHGYHNEDVPEGWGSTPILIIKEPGNSFEDTKFSSAPVSTADILGTIAVNVGLSDAEAIGTSIYDFDENSSRVRYFYDRVRDPSLPDVYSKGKLSYIIMYNAFAEYVIDGDSSVIYGVDPFENGNNIFPMKEYFG